MSYCEACENTGFLIVAPDGDVSRLEVQRCDACELYESDEQAAKQPEAQSELGLAKRLHEFMRPD